MFLRKFDAAEDKMRFKIFKTNVAAIDAQNDKFAKGKSTWKAGVNHFTDRQEHELPGKGLAFASYHTK